MPLQDSVKKVVNKNVLKFLVHVLNFLSRQSYQASILPCVLPAPNPTFRYLDLILVFLLQSPSRSISSSLFTFSVSLTTKEFASPIFLLLTILAVIPTRTFIPRILHLLLTAALLSSSV